MEWIDILLLHTEHRFINFKRGKRDRLQGRRVFMSMKNEFSESILG